MMKIVGYTGEWSLHPVARMVASAAPACGYFTLVAAKGREGEAMAVLRDLMPYLVNRQIVSAWPGTIKLDGETRIMLKFRAEPAAVGILVDDILPTLFSRDPPIEDVGLLRADGRPYLIMISHEQDVFLKLEPQEVDMLTAMFGLGAFQLQGDDVSPEETY